MCRFFFAPCFDCSNDFWYVGTLYRGLEKESGCRRWTIVRFVSATEAAWHLGNFAAVLFKSIDLRVHFGANISFCSKFFNHGVGGLKKDFPFREPQSIPCVSRLNMAAVFLFNAGDACF